MDGNSEVIAPSKPISEFSDIDEKKATNMSSQESGSPDGHTSPSHNSENEEANKSEDEDQDDINASANNDLLASHEKRVRKKVQRLSETLSRAHEEHLEKRAKVAKQVQGIFEGANGTELGAIPLIEDSIRKNKPVNLKPLHLIIYGRLGAMHEVRSNLRKFKGFGFASGSAEYEKKLASIQQRPMSEVREVLRILHLEVSGTREIMASRLLEFLHQPSASKVKYKGKIVKKPGKSRKSSGDKTARRKSSSKSNANEASSENVSQPDAESMESEASSSTESEHSDYEKPTKKRKKISKKPNGIKPPSKKRAITEDSISDIDDDEESKTSSPKTKQPKKVSDDDLEEDVPLSNLKKGAHPTDEDLKRSIVELLKTVDLEQTSLKVVREQIFARYPGVDLTDKKEFINATVKEYLAQA